MKNKYAIILAGGKGERFWPKSRLNRPKHLLPILGNQPMIAQTVARLEGIIPLENIFVITHIDQRDAICQVCSNLNPSHIIAEPFPKDTAAAIALGTALIYLKDPGASIVFLPADHAIHNKIGFQETLSWSLELAETTKNLITIGIQPTLASISYGYIKRGKRLHSEPRPTYSVECFVEKPNLETAQQYLDSGEFFWNAGMFAAKVESLKDLFDRLSSTHAQLILELLKINYTDSNFTAELTVLYKDLEKISFDYAIAEKTKDIITVLAGFDWDDVGEWSALFRHYPSDELGNVTQGKVLMHDSSDNLVLNENGHLTAIFGVKELIVVQTPEATLICPKNRSSELKQLLRQIESNADLKTLM